MLEARFDTIDARFEQIDTRFEGIETGLRYVNAQIEGLWNETKRLGEAIIVVDEKLERFRVETYERFDEVDRRFDRMERLIRPS